MANPTTPSELLFEAYLLDHGYLFERDLDWRGRFGVATDKNPDYLVSRAQQDLAVCEAKERTSTTVDRRLAEHRVGSFSSETVHEPILGNVEDAAAQLEPFKGVGLSLVAVLANPRHLFVPLGADAMTLSLFGTTSVVTLPSTGPATPSRALLGNGALAREDEVGNRYNPHPHLSAVVVVHTRTNEQDFAYEQAAAMRAADAPRTFEEANVYARELLDVLNATKRAGRTPKGEYSWVEVFDLAGLGEAFDGTPLPDNIFDGPRDHWYTVHPRRGLVERPN
jgi:hypothetical protein